MIHGLSMEYPCSIHGLSMDYSWTIHGVSMDLRLSSLIADLLNDNACVQGELNENRNLMWTKRGKARLILIFNTNTNC